MRAKRLSAREARELREERERVEVERFHAILDHQERVREEDEHDTRYGCYCCCPCHNAGD